MKPHNLHCLNMPNAPALFFCAGTSKLGSDTISATGLGTTKSEAEARCRSELAERIALHNIPKAEIYGSAAAETQETAAARAAMELGERNAAMQWWAGIVRPLQLSQDDRRVWQTLNKRFSRSRTSALQRKSGLAALANTTGAPVYAAWSCDANNKSIAIATASRSVRAEAIAAALKELFQMELGIDIVRHKARHGAQLTDREQVMIARSRHLDITALEPLLAVQETPDQSARDFCRQRQLNQLGEAAAVQSGSDRINLRFFTQGAYQVALATNLTRTLDVVRHPSAPDWPLY